MVFKNSFKEISKAKKIDLLFLVLYPVLCYFLLLFLKTNSLVGVFLFYFLPVLYLSVRSKLKINKIAVFSFIFLPVYVLFEAIGNISGIWFAPTSFSFRLITTTVEGTIMAFLLIFMTILFYKHFLDEKTLNLKQNKKIKYLSFISIIAFLIFLIIFFINKSLLIFDYFYLIFGVVFILIPIVLELLTHKRLFKKFFLTTLYFLYINLLFELVALKNSWWYFFRDDQYVGFLTIIGQRIPLEEIFFFVILLTTAIVTYFEFFADDNK